MIQVKKIVSWVLAAVALAGLGGCWKLPQSVPKNSELSSEISSNELASSISSITEQTGSATKNLTETKLDSGISVINLTNSIFGLDIDEIWFFKDNLIGVIAYNNFYVFSSENLNFIYQKTFTFKDGYLKFYRHGEFSALYSSNNGIHTFYDVNKTEISPITEEQFLRFQLSDSSFILERDNNLVLEQNGKTKTILTGVMPAEGEDILSGEVYFFDCRLSDTRFIYSKNGYEISLEIGIYDIETGKTTLLSHKNADYLVEYTSDNGKVIFAPVDPSSFSSIGPYLYDDSTGELTDLDWLNFLEGDEIIHPDYFLFGNTLVAFVDDDITTKLRFFDLTTRTETKVIEIPSSLGISGNSMNGFFTTKNNLWFYSTSKDGYLFRIPMEVVKK
ncbi:MAG TPA: hypothetical protein PLG58_07460 [Flexilinea sp.]|nr:hypothetical protein [Flexilinea sp.]